MSAGPFTWILLYRELKKETISPTENQGFEPLISFILHAKIIWACESIMHFATSALNDKCICKQSIRMPEDRTINSAKKTVRDEQVGRTDGSELMLKHAGFHYDIISA